MGIPNLILLAFGAVFLGAAVVMGRSFIASMDRSVPVRAQVTGFRTEETHDRERGWRTYYYAQFQVVGGPNDGATGESPLGSTRRLYDEDAVVDAAFDTQTGAITGTKGTRATKAIIGIFTLIGGGLLIGGLLVRA